MADNRFSSYPTDARFPSAGVDREHGPHTLDARFMEPEGTDTRFGTGYAAYGDNLYAPEPQGTGWTNNGDGTLTCTGGDTSNTSRLQFASGLSSGKTYRVAASILSGTASVILRRGSTTLNASWDGSPQNVTNAANVNVLQVAGGYTIGGFTVNEVL